MRNRKFYNKQDNSKWIELQLQPQFQSSLPPNIKQQTQIVSIISNETYYLSRYLQEAKIDESDAIQFKESGKHIHPKIFIYTPKKPIIIKNEISVLLDKYQEDIIVGPPMRLKTQVSGASDTSDVSTTSSAGEATNPETALLASSSTVSRSRMPSKQQAAAAALVPSFAALRTSSDDEASDQGSPRAPVLDREDDETLTLTFNLSPAPTHSSASSIQSSSTGQSLEDEKLISSASSASAPAAFFTQSGSQVLQQRLNLAAEMQALSTFLQLFQKKAAANDDPLMTRIQLAITQAQITLLTKNLDTATKTLLNEINEIIKNLTKNDNTPLLIDLFKEVDLYDGDEDELKPPRQVTQQDMSNGIRAAAAAKRAITPPNIQ